MRIRNALLVLQAWGLLVFFQLALKRVPFEQVYRRVARLPQPTRPDHDPGEVERAFRATQTAARLVYRDRKDCLPRALTTLLLLRRAGASGELCLGVRTCPFEGHAWVEIGGRVLDDDPNRVAGYTVVHRS